VYVVIIWNDDECVFLQNMSMSGFGNLVPSISSFRHFVLAKSVIRYFVLSNPVSRF